MVFDLLNLLILVNWTVQFNRGNGVIFCTAPLDEELMLWKGKREGSVSIRLNHTTFG
jgi:hypothetical protein